LLKAFTQEREGKRGGRLKRGLSLRGVEGSNGCKPFVPGTVQSDPESLPNSKELARSWQGVGKELGVDFNVLKNIADFCVEAHSLAEIAKHLGLGDRYKMKKKYIDPILGKYIEMTIPEAPNSKLQKYILTDTGRELSKIKL
jgi:hypothetical protein